VVQRACLTALEESVKAPAAQPEIREVMDIRQAAHYMGISADSLYRYASTGFIPAFRLGNRWRFRKSRLDEWMDRRSGLEEAPAPKLVRSQKKPVRSTRVLGRPARTGS
jgi:excisionase family DNA binding protein